MATAGNKGSKAAPSSRVDIVNDVAAQLDLPQAQVDRVVRAYEEAIIRTLTGGGEARIAGFGSFKTSQRAARTARNPQTGGTVKVAARTVPRFSPSSAFKDSVNGSKGGAKGGSKGGAAKGGSKGAAAAKGGAAKGGAAKGGAKGGAAKGGSKGGRK